MDVCEKCCLHYSGISDSRPSDIKYRATVVYIIDLYICVQRTLLEVQINILSTLR